MQLSNALCSSLKNNKDKIALEIDDRFISYEELDIFSDLLANSLLNTPSKTQEDRVLIFGYRCPTTYIAITACIKANITFVPLNPKFPKERLLLIIKNSKANKMVVSESCKDAFLKLQDELDCMEIFCNFDLSTNKHKLNPLESKLGKQKRCNNTAYILFTSGSTGVPKGVEVSRDNLYAYTNKIIKDLAITSLDRSSNMFDITFDVAMHDIFCTLISGGTLCVVPDNLLINPIRFIQQKNLTIFFSVPSLIRFLTKLKVLKEGFLPSLRLSLFCGEALSRQDACSWSLCANKSDVYNLYGPTETTIIAIKYLCFKNGKIYNEKLNEDGIPLGNALEGLEISLRDEHGDEVANGENGEIWISGDQVAIGYLHDSTKTNEKFIHKNNKRWYKTGDIGIKKQIGSELLYCYCGRIDDQVKIQGYRIELLEVDLKLSKITNLPCCTIVINENGINKLIGIVETNEIDTNEVIMKCNDELPHFMIPSKLVTLDKFPLNANGKVDRNRIKEEILCKRMLN